MGDHGRRDGQVSTLTLGIDEDLQGSLDQIKEAFADGSDAGAPLSPPISATGVATRRRLPDRAVVAVTLEADGADDVEARAKLTVRLDRLAGLVEGSDCRQSAPVRCTKTTVGEGDARGEWFTATTSVVLRLDPGEFFGTVLQLLLEGYSPAAPTYEFDEAAPLGSDLHREAAADARSKIEAIAEGAQFGLGEVVGVDLVDAATSAATTRFADLVANRDQFRGTLLDDRWKIQPAVYSMASMALIPSFGNLRSSVSGWFSRGDGTDEEPAVPVVEDLGPEVDAEVLEFLGGEIPVRTTTVTVGLTVQVLPLA